MTKRKNLIVISVTIMITVFAVIIGYSVRKISIVDTSKLAEQRNTSKIEIPEESKLNTIKTQEINEANLSEKPNVSLAWLHAESEWGYQKIGDNFYLKKGSKIRIGVLFNEDVYDEYRSWR